MIGPKLTELRNTEHVFGYPKTLRTFVTRLILGLQRPTWGVFSVIAVSTVAVLTLRHVEIKVKGLQTLYNNTPYAKLQIY